MDVQVSHIIEIESIMLKVFASQWSNIVISDFDVIHVEIGSNIFGLRFKVEINPRVIEAEGIWLQFEILQS